MSSRGAAGVVLGLRRRTWAGLAGVTVAGVALTAAVLHSAPVTELTATGQAVVAQGNGQSNDQCVTPSNGQGNCLSTFGVSVGAVNPIYPTQTRTLPVTFSNPNSFAIVVDSWKPTVSVPAGSACPASALSVPTDTRTAAGPPSVPAKGSASVTLPVTLLNTAPNACQRVTFAVTVTATAVKK